MTSRTNGQISNVLYDSNHKDLIEVIQGDQSETTRLSDEGLLLLCCLNGSGGLI